MDTFNRGLLNIFISLLQNFIQSEELREGLVLEIAYPLTIGEQNEIYDFFSAQKIYCKIYPALFSPEDGQLIEKGFLILSATKRGIYAKEYLLEVEEGVVIE